MSNNSQELLRKLKIKTGSVKRIHKELLSYGKEVEQQLSRIDKMKAENADPYSIKKQGEVLDESKAMIPDTKKRLEAAYKELEDQLQEIENANIPSLLNQEDYKTAQVVLSEVEQVISS